MSHAGHWQDKQYPYPPYLGRTLGDGVLLSLDMSSEYWWCWIGIAVSLAYILLLNVILVLCLAFLPAYGDNATIAKTAEELEDRRAALYGEGRDANDVVIDLPVHVADAVRNGAADPKIQAGFPVSNCTVCVLVELFACTQHLVLHFWLSANTLLHVPRGLYCMHTHLLHLQHIFSLRACLLTGVLLCSAFLPRKS